MPTKPVQSRTDLDISRFRGVLEEERARLLDELDKLDALDETGGPAGEVGELADYDQHMADQATETFLREQDQAIEIGLKTSLDQVDRALHKLEAGSYGCCDRCGTEIPIDRLEILPSAIYCIPCAAELSARF